MDLKFALRSLGKNPGFTILAVLVMALGIGANTAVFSVVNAVLLKPLAYRDPDRIVTIRNFWKNTGNISSQASAPDFHDWHDQSAAFEAMAYYSGSGADGSTTVLNGTSAEFASVTNATPEFFDVFGVKTLAGRMFNGDEQKPGSGAALISDVYWHTHFGGNSNVLGKTLRIYDKPLIIIGVMPPGFSFPRKTDIWIPAEAIFPENNVRSSHNYQVVARLKPGISIGQAQAQLSAIAAKIEQAFPRTNKNKGVTVAGMLDTMVTNVHDTLYMLLGAVGLVLLIACANMANLLLAKSTSRTREIAIRAAVGASRGRIVRQLITESIVLAFAAGVVGLIFAVWGVYALVQLAPANVPRLTETGIDDRWVFAFTFGISILSSVLFGLAPALQASRVDVNDSLKQGSAKNTSGGGAGHIRNVLVVAEIALSVILLTGAGLLIRSFQALTNVDLGYRPEKILVAKTDVPVSDDKGLARAVQFDTDILADFRALPGATSVGASAATPGTVRSNGAYIIDTLPPRDQLGITKEQAVFSVIAPGTFETLGMALKRGRDFNDTDTHDTFFTAIVNEALVKESFPNRDPMGKLIFCGMDSMNPMKIVGVVGNVRQWGPAAKPWPEIYMPYQQHPGFATQMSLLIRTPNDPGTLKAAIERKIRERNPEVPVRISLLTATVDQSVATPKFRTLLLGIFAGLAVALAMAGVYGVMAYVVSQRSNEIGLRMALGARSSDVLGLVLKQAMILTAAGLAIGLAGAFATSRILTGLLFEVKPNDPATYIAVSAMLALVALIASFIPARRAAKVDPLIALRQE